MAERESARWEAVVLAAGAGRRFAEQGGGRKLLAPFEGRPLIAGALDAAFAAPVQRVVLATDGDPDLAAVARDLARQRGRSDDLSVITVADAAEGLGASLRAATAALSPGVDGAFVFLGDMPRIPWGLAQDLAAAIGPGAELAAPVFEGRRGHPVLFGRACFPALLASRGDVGARALLQDAGARMARVTCADPGVLFDVDLPQDLAQDLAQNPA